MPAFPKTGLWPSPVALCKPADPFYHLFGGFFYAVYGVFSSFCVSFHAGMQLRLGAGSVLPSIHLLLQPGAPVDQPWFSHRSGPALVWYGRMRHVAHRQSGALYSHCGCLPPPGGAVPGDHSGHDADRVYCRAFIHPCLQSAAVGLLPALGKHSGHHLPPVHPVLGNIGNCLLIIWCIRC